MNLRSCLSACLPPHSSCHAGDGNTRQRLFPCLGEREENISTLPGQEAFTTLNTPHLHGRQRKATSLPPPHTFPSICFSPPPHTHTALFYNSCCGCSPFNSNSGRWRCLGMPSSSCYFLTELTRQTLTPAISGEGETHSLAAPISLYINRGRQGWAGGGRQGGFDLSKQCVAVGGVFGMASLPIFSNISNRTGGLPTKNTFFSPSSPTQAHTFAQGALHRNISSN